MSLNIGGRALRACDVCGLVDDHPRHVLAGGNGNAYPAPEGAIVRLVADVLRLLAPADADRIMADLLDTGSQTRHMDCCRSRGCPTGDCNSAPDLRGGALLDALTGKG